MKFSVLVPVYNAERYLVDCIQSILNQRCQDFELILVDDGSTDKSGEICDSYKCQYAEKIQVVHKKNAGLLAARQDAFSMASGEYCVCVDSDDLLDYNALSIFDEIINEQNPDFILYDLLCFSGNNKDQVYKENCILNSGYYSDLTVLKESLLNLSYCNWSMCGKCIRTHFVKNNTVLHKYINISYGEDTLQTILLYNKATNFVYTDEKIYYYRVDNGMTKKLPSKHLEDYKVITDIIRTECSTWTEDIDHTVKKYYSTIQLMHINNIIKTSDNYQEIKNRIYDFHKRSLYPDELRRMISSLKIPHRWICLCLIRNRCLLPYVYILSKKYISRYIKH